MSFAVEIAKGFAEICLLLEVDWTEGPGLYAIAPYELDASTYHGPRISSMGTINRRLSAPWTGLQSTQFRVDLINIDGQLLMNPDSILNRSARVSLAANGQIQTYFTGLVTEYGYEEGGLKLTIADRGEQYIGLTNKWWQKMRFTGAEFPGIEPSLAGSYAPIGWGVHDSRGAGNTGTIPCIPLSATKYAVMGLACQGVHAVYEDGLMRYGGWWFEHEAWPAGVGGYLTTINFVRAPRGTVTCDCSGMTQDLTPTGKRLTNPVEVAEVLRKEVFGVPDAMTDPARIAVASEYCARYGLRTAGYVRGGTLAREIMHQLLYSAMLFGGWTDDGKWALWPPKTEGQGQAINNTTDILAGSLSYGPLQNAMINDLSIAYKTNHAGGGAMGEIRTVDAASQAALGREYIRSFDLTMAADWCTAYSIKELLINRFGATKQAKWQGPLTHVGSIDLGDVINLTSPWLPDATGAPMENAPFLVTGINLDWENSACSYESIDLSSLPLALRGNGFRVGDALPGEVR